MGRTFSRALMAVAAFAVLSPAYAYYYGDGLYGEGTYNVGQLLATTTTLSSSTNPSTAGNAITLSATVSPATATGTLTFKDGGTTLGAVTLGHASGSLAVTSLSAGSHSLTAVYAGNVTHSGSTSAVLTQTVNAVTSTSAASSSAVDSPQSSGGGSHGRTFPPLSSRSAGPSATLSPGQALPGTGVVPSSARTFAERVAERRKRRLTHLKTAPVRRPVPVIESPPPQASWSVAASALRMRAGPGITEPQLRLLPFGTAITILDFDTSPWAHVRLDDGAEGYVSTLYLRKPRN